MRRLNQWFKSQESVLVAFSGGVDSSLLAKIAYLSLGDKSLAVSGESPSLPQSELKETKRIAAEIGINHNGDLGIAKDLIDVAVDAGADAVKFQKRTLELDYPQSELGSQVVIDYQQRFNSCDYRLQEALMLRAARAMPRSSRLSSSTSSQSIVSHLTGTNIIVEGG